MTQYQDDIEAIRALKEQNGSSWDAIDPESVARMRAQNRFRTGLEIAQYTADIMRRDMAEYDADSSVYTQSLGVWHGFIGQQKLISIKKHLKTTNKRYLYLSGWMVAALRSEFGPLPDQSMHEKTAVPALIEELYTFLRQADARELDLLFTQLDDARVAGDETAVEFIQSQIDNYETHVVPIIADIDAGFGNPEATYLLAKKMIEAGACAIQIENQVSDEKQCGHQDGKVTVPHEDFIAKLNAVRYAFLELGIDNGVIVARTDSLGAGLTQKLAVTTEPGDLGDQYNAFLDVEEISEADLGNGDVVIKRDGTLLRPKRLASNLYQFRAGTGEARCRARLHHVAAQRCRPAVDRDREAPRGADRRHGRRDPQGDPEREARLQQQPVVQLDAQLPPAGVRPARGAGCRMSPRYDRADLMNVDYDGTELARLADEKIRSFQKDGSARAGIFHHLITLPTYHTAALSTDDLAKGYFGDEGMLAYVKGVQRREIREGIATVKHQNMAGSDIGDNHKEYFAGDAALKAGGQHNTMNQFN